MKVHECSLSEIHIICSNSCKTLKKGEMHFYKSKKFFRIWTINLNIESDLNSWEVDFLTCLMLFQEILTSHVIWFHPLTSYNKVKKSMPIIAWVWKTWRKSKKMPLTDKSIKDQVLTLALSNLSNIKKVSQKVFSILD